MTSALFSVNGSSTQQAHAVAFGSTVTLAVVDSAGVNSVDWSIAGKANSADASPTITVATRTTASFVMPSDPGHAVAFLVRCTVNGGRGIDGRMDAALTSGRVVGTAHESGLVPLCANETTERDATVGWAALINGLLSPAAQQAAVNPLGIVPLGLFTVNTEWAWSWNTALEVLYQAVATTNYRLQAEITHLLYSGQTLTGAAATLRAASHANLPATMPHIWLQYCSATVVDTSPTMQSIGDAADAAADVSAYGGEHEMSFTATPHIVDLSQYRYFISMHGESGANSATALSISRVRFLTE